MSSISHTSECQVSQLHPVLSRAIWEYARLHQVGNLDTETRMCCETVAEKRRTGKFSSLIDGNPDTTMHLALLFTDDWLVWARSGDQSGTVVNGARLKVIRVKVFVSRRSKDFQLEVSGFINDSKEYVRGNLEMGPDLVAQRFCEQVGQAVSKVNPPPKRKFFGLMSG